MNSDGSEAPHPHKEEFLHQPRRPRTLIFCTAYATQVGGWNTRYRRWIDAIKRSRLSWDQLLLIDDGSKVLPDWDDLQIIRSDEALAPTKPVALYHFPDNLGRHALFDFPGWYRSFTFASTYAAATGIEKIVHLESDAFLISPRIVTYVNDVNDGWIALWCKIHQMPESAIQVIAGTAVASFRAVCEKPHSDFVGRGFEWQLPFTHVETSFIGDRYGEYLEWVPRSADYAAQAGAGPNDRYYWWLSDRADIDEASKRDEDYLCLYYDARHMADNKCDPHVIMSTYLRAAEIRRDRVEALYAASMFCFATGQNELGYQIAKRGLGIEAPGGSLQVQGWMYEFGLLDAYGLNGYWSGHYRDSLDAYLQALASSAPSKADRKRFLANARHALQKLVAV